MLIDSYGSCQIQEPGPFAFSQTPLRHTIAGGLLLYDGLQLPAQVGQESRRQVGREQLCEFTKDVHFGRRESGAPTQFPCRPGDHERGGILFDHFDTSRCC